MRTILLAALLAMTLAGAILMVLASRPTSEGGGVGSTDAGSSVASRFLHRDAAELDPLVEEVRRVGLRRASSEDALRQRSHAGVNATRDLVSRVRTGPVGYDTQLDSNGSDVPTRDPVYRVFGRALDEGGRPVTEIDLRISNSLEGLSTTVPVQSDGGFEIHSLEPGPHVIVAVHTVTGEVLQRTIHESTPEIELVFRTARPFVVEGYCHDTDGIPLDGAEVTLLGHPGVVVSTDVRGYFRLHSYGAAERVQVRARAAGYRSETLGVVLESSTEEIRWGAADFVLESLGVGASIRGVVVDERGQPVAATQIELVVLATGFRDRTTTDTDGVFFFEGLAAERCSVRAIPPRKFEATQAEVSLASLDFASVELVTPHVDEVLVRGTLVDPVGHAIAHLPIEVRSSGRADVSTRVTTDARGRFEAELPACGRVLVDTIGGPAATARGPSLEGARTIDVVVTLGIGDETLIGRVIDTADRTLGGVRVALFWDGAEGRGTSRRQFNVVVDAAGEFSLRGLPTGSYRAIVRAADGRYLSTSLELPTDRWWEVQLPSY